MTVNSPRRPKLKRFVNCHSVGPVLLLDESEPNFFIRKYIFVKKIMANFFHKDNDSFPTLPSPFIYPREIPLLDG